MMGVFGSVAEIGVCGVGKEKMVSGGGGVLENGYPLNANGGLGIGNSTKSGLKVPLDEDSFNGGLSGTRSDERERGGGVLEDEYPLNANGGLGIGNSTKVLDENSFNGGLSETRSDEGERGSEYEDDATLTGVFAVDRAGVVVSDSSGLERTNSTRPPIDVFHAFNEIRIILEMAIAHLAP